MSVAFECAPISSHMLTLLIRTCRHTQSLISPIRLVGTSIELLITAPLQCSSEVDKGVALDLEFSIRVTGIGNGRGSNTAQRSGKGLKILTLALWKIVLGSWGSEGRHEERGNNGSSLHRDI